MNNITITTSATITSLDGALANAPSSAFQCEVDELLEFTRDIDASTASVCTGGWMFAAVFNVGENDITAEVSVLNDYQTFIVPHGGHILIPAALKDTAGVWQYATNLVLAALSGDSRAHVVIGVRNA